VYNTFSIPYLARIKIYILIFSHLYEKTILKLPRTGEKSFAPSPFPHPPPVLFRYSGIWLLPCLGEVTSRARWQGYLLSSNSRTCNFFSPFPSATAESHFSSPPPVRAGLMSAPSSISRLTYFRIFAFVLFPLLIFTIFCIIQNKHEICF